TVTRMAESTPNTPANHREKWNCSWNVRVSRSSALRNGRYRTTTLATLAITTNRKSNVIRRRSTYTESITSSRSNSMLAKIAEADFPSEYGHFRIYGFERRELGMPEPEEAVVLKLGSVIGPPPLVRVHSECLTGDVL